MSDANLRVFSLHPLTPLMFRTPKPFDLGESAESLYLPQPGTIVGMIRSAIWEALNKSFDPHELSKKPEFTGVYLIDGEFKTTYNFKWRLVGPYLYKYKGNDKGVYYPLPLDVFVVEQASNTCKRKRIFDLVIPHEKSMRELSDLFGIMGSPMPATQKYLRELLTKKIKRMPNVFIHIDDMKRLLNIAYEERSEDHPIIKEVRIKQVRDIFRRYEEPHVKLDRQKKTVEMYEGKGLYFTTRRVILNEDWRIIFGLVSLEDELENYFDKLNNRIARLGGEGGLVRIQEEKNIRFIEYQYFQNLDQEVDKRLKLVIASPTPLINDSGDDTWYPPKLGVPRYYAIRQTLVGGWDYCKQMPKPLHRGIGDGSVYCYELKNRFTYRDLILDRIHVPEEFRGAYGSVLIGKW